MPKFEQIGPRTYVQTWDTYSVVNDVFAVARWGRHWMLLWRDGDAQKGLPHPSKAVAIAAALMATEELQA